jgi:alkaline phosphatase D
MKNTLLILLVISSYSAACQGEIRASIDPVLYPFYHGVASGDPLSDRVILWTRVTEDTLTVDSVEQVMQKRV